MGGPKWNVFVWCDGDTQQLRSRPQNGRTGQIVRRVSPRRPSRSLHKVYTNMQIEFKWRTGSVIIFEWMNYPTVQISYFALKTGLEI